MNTHPKNGEFCWNDLMTNDVEKAKEFYAALLGWTYEDTSVDEPYAMISSEGTPMGGIVEIPSHAKDKIPAHWMSYVNVEDLDATVKKAVSLGAILVAPARACGSFGRAAVIQDPTGAYLSFWESAKA